VQTSSKPSVAEVPLPVKVSEQKLVTVYQQGPPVTKREELVWKRFFYEHQVQLMQRMVDLLDEAISHV
jgi:hypothetical protein